MITDTSSNILHVPTRHSAEYYSVSPIWVTIQALCREVVEPPCEVERAIGRQRA